MGFETRAPLANPATRDHWLTGVERLSHPPRVREIENFRPDHAAPETAAGPELELSLVAMELKKLNDLNGEGAANPWHNQIEEARQILSLERTMAKLGEGCELPRSHNPSRGDPPRDYCENGKKDQLDRQDGENDHPIEWYGPERLLRPMEEREQPQCHSGAMRVVPDRKCTKVLLRVAPDGLRRDCNPRAPHAVTGPEPLPPPAKRSAPDVARPPRRVITPRGSPASPGFATPFASAGRQSPVRIALSRLQKQHSCQGGVVTIAWLGRFARIKFAKPS